MKIVVLCLVLLCGVVRDASAASDTAALFTRKCSSCHSYGKGDLVGPDLKGATDRHSRAWLTAWISSSEQLIRSGDPAATALFRKYKQQRMPDQSLSAGDMSALLDFLAAGGPEAEARGRDRRADTATQAEVEMGRTLFVGQRAPAGGGVSCSACHSAGKSAAGGSLGPDLTHAYSKFQDKALSLFLARGCFPTLPESGKALTVQESFALRAFLRQAETGRHALDAAGTRSQR